MLNTNVFLNQNESLQFFDGDFEKHLSNNTKPFLHELLYTENVDEELDKKIKEIYFNSFYVKSETPKIIPSLHYTIEPRFILGRSENLQTLAKIAKIKIEKYNIKQIVAPGVGGICAINTFLFGTQNNINSAIFTTFSKNKRVKSQLVGYLNKKLPVWITDDLLTSGKAALEIIKFLHLNGYWLGGFIPVFAHLHNNIGHRTFENFKNHHITNFVYDYLVGLQHPKKSELSQVKIYKFRTNNSILYDR